MISILLVAGSGGLFAQDKFRPTAIRVGLGLSDAVYTAVSPDRTQLQVTADVDFYKYFLSIDAGTLDRTRSGDNFEYSTSGQYVRIGPDANFLHKDPDKSVFFIGARVAFARFSEDFSFDIGNNVYGNVAENRGHDGINARWFELVTGLKVSVFGNFYLGFTGRYKFGRSVDDNGSLTSYDIPGYGLAERGNYWGMDYYIYYRFGARK